MLKTKIKASSVTNLTDARYFAAWQVKWLGFHFDTGSERYISPQNMRIIREWIDGVQIVGEFNLHSAEEISAAIDMLQLDAVQAGMFTDSETLIELQSQVPVIKEIIVEGASTEPGINELMLSFAPHAQYFQLNFDKNNIDWASLQQDQPLSLDFLTDICRKYPVILSIDLNADNVLDILDTLPLAGLNLTGGEEERVGFKSFDELDDIFEQLEVEV